LIPYHRHQLLAMHLTLLTFLAARRWRNMESFNLFKERVQEANPIEQVIGETIKLTPRGNELVGQHQTHDSISGASFTVSPERGLYYCFNCQESGNVFNWIMRLRNCSYTEALKLLAARAKLPLPEWTPKDRARQEALWKEREIIQRIYAETARFYNFRLTKRWELWCKRQWGLTPETLRQYQVGFASNEGDTLWLYLQEQKFKAADLQKSGLFIRTKTDEWKDFFQGRIVFPYWLSLPQGEAANGVIVYFIGRQTPETPEWDKGSKYKKLLTKIDKNPYVSETVSNRYFFGEHSLGQARNGTLLVAEGIADALAALQAGIPCISPVTVSFGEADWPRLVTLTKSVQRTVIVNDNEENRAGEKGALKTAAHLFKNQRNARIGTLPRPEGVEKVDIADYLKTNTPENLRQVMTEAKPLLEIYIEKVQQAADADKAKAAEEVYPLIGALDGVSRDAAEKKLQLAMGGNKNVSIKALREEIDTAAEREDNADRRPYVEIESRLYTCAGDPVADFTARITKSYVHEDGSHLFCVEGRTPDGSKFSCEIPAKTFADERRLKAELANVAGVSNPVRAGMVGHLGPAIQLLSPADTPQFRRYTRTGWADGRFLLPGREPEGVSIVLPRKLSYRIPKSARLGTGQQVLDKLIRCMPESPVLVAVAAAFEAPLAALAGWRDERYAVFVRGLTGSFKTSWTQVLLSMYGPEFLDDGLLLKLGLGTTPNAAMALSTHAHDMPFFIDNYKPNTCSPRELITLIHNMLEGGEKERLNRAAELKDTKPVFCWPFLTGEDIPDSDAASLARILVVPFTRKDRSKPNPRLDYAQQNARHLSAVGEAWLSWLESPDGKRAAKEASSRFEAVREVWLKKLPSSAVNPHRVATNLATNALTWSVLTEHPELGKIARRYAKRHTEHLETVATATAQGTSESLEATRFLSALQELVTSNRFYLDRIGEVPDGDTWGGAPSRDGRDNRMLGWMDANTVYLFPELSQKAVSDVLERDGFAKLSARGLHNQLESLGAIADRDPSRFTKVKSIAGQKHRVLWLKRSALSP
jgi:DNA primase catalytic core